MGRLFNLSFCFTALMCSAANSQQPEKYFVFGLDSFYEADYERVVAHMDTAESLGLKDARMYLYRGIAKLRSGSDKDGRADLQLAAERQARFGTRYIGRLVERLDGTEWATISEYRENARIALIKREDDDARELVTDLPTRADAATVLGTLVISDDATDPFLDDSLGRGELVEPTVAASGHELGDVGELDTGAAPFADGDTGFDSSFDTSADGEFDAGDFAADPPTDKKKKGIFGSILGAIGNAAIPTKTIENIASQIPGGIPGATPPGAGPPAGFGPMDGTEDGTTADGGFDDSGFDGDSFSADDTDSEDDGFDFDDESEEDEDPFVDDDF